VDPQIFERLRALNHEFYQTFPVQFAEKRTRLQPGVLRALGQIDPGHKILDLGCGHGTLAESLVAGGHQGTYLGLDLSEGMINLARNAVEHPCVHFAQADLSQSTWQESFQALPASFQAPYAQVLSFASLHHIPAADRRTALVAEVFPLIEPGGCWILSVWDFLQSERLQARILPWSSMDIDPDQVDEGDYLIDWRHGGQGLRYVHHFSQQALGELAGSAGFEVTETYHMDGENGRLGLYQVWRRP
jgi:tRNA (uracil-5-)-methyltransferase TRM9